MASLRILRAGPGATIQDAGRRFYRRYGVTPAGPMDWAAFRTANLALGNDVGAAAIEIGLGGLELCCEEAPVSVAFCGGAFAWSCAGKRLAAARCLTLKPSERLSVRAGDFGAFTYLAVEGGLQTLPVLGSRATHLRARLGGIEGRMLRDADVLPIAPAMRPRAEAEIAAPWLAKYEWPLRVILGPQDDYFTAAALETFFAAEFRLTHMADRMAYRLEGPKIAHKEDFNIISDGIALGAIQIAGDGQPLVLMAEHQPTGGYPKLGHIARADIFRLAQMRPGETCRFVSTDVESARAALLSLEAEIAQTLSHLKPSRHMPTSEELLRINLISGVVGGLDK